jgi:hypothetical protein
MTILLPGVGGIAQGYRIPRSTIFQARPQNAQNRKLEQSDQSGVPKRAVVPVSKDKQMISYMEIFLAMASAIMALSAGSGTGISRRLVTAASQCPTDRARGGR